MEKIQSFLPSFPKILCVFYYNFGSSSERNDNRVSFFSSSNRAIDCHPWIKNFWLFSNHHPIRHLLYQKFHKILTIAKILLKCLFLIHPLLYIIFTNFIKFQIFLLVNYFLRTFQNFDLFFFVWFPLNWNLFSLLSI